MLPNPPMVTVTTANSRPQHSLPDSGPKPTCMRAAQRMGHQEAAPVPSLIQTPLLIWWGALTRL